MKDGERVRAIVLRRTNYSEADRVVQLLTTKGRRSVIAKGVRREKSKLAGGIELFAISDVVIRQGKGELGLLTSARMVAFYRHILEDYERMQFAYNVLKLVAQASEAIDEPAWFTLTAEVLEHLDDLSVNRQLIETWFYINYAGLLGEELNLQIDVSGHELVPGTMYMYDETERVFRLSEQGGLGEDHIKLLRLMNVKTLAQVAQIGGVEEVINDCWLVSRQHAAV